MENLSENSSENKGEKTVIVAPFKNDIPISHIPTQIMKRFEEYQKTGQVLKPRHRADWVLYGLLKGKKIIKKRTDEEKALTQKEYSKLVKEKKLQAMRKELEGVKIMVYDPSTEPEIKSATTAVCNVQKEPEIESVKIDTTRISVLNNL